MIRIFVLSVAVYVAIADEVKDFKDCGETVCIHAISDLERDSIVGNSYLHLIRYEQRCKICHFSIII